MLEFGATVAEKGVDMRCCCKQPVHGAQPLDGRVDNRNDKYMFA